MRYNQLMEKHDNAIGELRTLLRIRHGRKKDREQFYRFLHARIGHIRFLRTCPDYTGKEKT